MALAKLEFLWRGGVCEVEKVIKKFGSGEDIS
jgi:hypothetical protein